MIKVVYIYVIISTEMKTEKLILFLNGSCHSFLDPGSHVA